MAQVCLKYSSLIHKPGYERWHRFWELPLYLLCEPLTTKEDVLRGLPNVRQNHVVLPKSFPKGEIKHTSWYTEDITGPMKTVFPTGTVMSRQPPNPSSSHLSSLLSSTHSPAVAATLRAAPPASTSARYHPGICHHFLPSAPEFFPLPPCSSLLLSFYPTLQIPHCSFLVSTHTILPSAPKHLKTK